MGIIETLKRRGGLELSLYNQDEVVKQTKSAEERAKLGDWKGIDSTNYPAIFFHDSSLLVDYRREAVARRLERKDQQRKVFQHHAERITAEIKNLHRVVDSLFGEKEDRDIPEAEPLFNPSYNEKQALDYAVNSGLHEVVSTITFPSLAGLEDETIERLEREAREINNQLRNNVQMDGDYSLGFDTNTLEEEE